MTWRLEWYHSFLPQLWSSYFEVYSFDCFFLLFIFIPHPKTTQINPWLLSISEFVQQKMSPKSWAERRWGCQANSSTRRWWWVYAWNSTTFSRVFAGISHDVVILSFLGGVYIRLPYLHPNTHWLVTNVAYLMSHFHTHFRIKACIVLIICLFICRPIL